MNEGKLYTEEEVVVLLKKQREICSRSAKIIENEQPTPFGDVVSLSIDKKSILNARRPKLF